jgi:hypothetical protein
MLAILARGAPDLAINPILGIGPRLWHWHVDASDFVRLAAGDPAASSLGRVG